MTLIVPALCGFGVTLTAVQIGRDRAWIANGRTVSRACRLASEAPEDDRFEATHERDEPRIGWLPLEHRENDRSLGHWSVLDTGMGRWS